MADAASPSAGDRTPRESAPDKAAEPAAGRPDKPGDPKAGRDPQFARNGE